MIAHLSILYPRNPLLSPEKLLYTHQEIDIKTIVFIIAENVNTQNINPQESKSIVIYLHNVILFSCENELQLHVTT